MGTGPASLAYESQRGYGIYGEGGMELGGIHSRRLSYEVLFGKLPLCLHFYFERDACADASLVVFLFLSFFCYTWRWAVELTVEMYSINRDI